MSNTPRTDEIIKDFVSGNGEAASIMLLRQDVEQLETELAEMRAEIERKDKLIEQMREALRAWVRRPDIPLREAIKVTEAALEAAEKVG
jgi:cell division protein FtsB